MDIEDIKIIEKIKGVQAEFISTGGDIKLVEENNFHFTLAFLGEINEYQKNKICKFLQGLQKENAKITLKGIGAFPSTNNPRVIWIGVSEGREILERSAKVVMSFLKENNMSFDENFEPHLTIARLRSQKNKGSIVAKIMELSNLEVGETLTSPIRLKKSTLTPSGPIYETLCEAGGNDI